MGMTHSFLLAHCELETFLRKVEGYSIKINLPRDCSVRIVLVNSEAQLDTFCVLQNTLEIVPP
jgi:hypothetical protein